MSIILDEKSYAEELISNPVLGKKPGETLGRIARYYRHSGYRSSEISNLLEDYILKCDPTINIVKWQNLIDRSVKLSLKYGLVEIDGIHITEHELQCVQSLEKQVLQKLLFCMVCVAKYCNEVNPKNNNWVNIHDKELFALAGIRTTIKRQSFLINELWDIGFIGFSNVIDNININVKIIDYSSPVVFTVTDFRNLGNQYLMFCGEPYLECQCCGAVVKRNGSAQKYCVDCAKAVNVNRVNARYVCNSH